MRDIGGLVITVAWRVWCRNGRDGFSIRGVHRVAVCISIRLDVGYGDRVAARRCEVVDVGWAALGVGDEVIEVAASGRHPTPGEHASWVRSLDGAALLGGRTATGDSSMDRAVWCGDCVAPSSACLLSCDLASNVGDHRAEIVEFSGCFREAGKGLEANLYIDCPSVFAGSPMASVGGAFEEVKVDVGA
jgi:hypothetical protein